MAPMASRASNGAEGLDASSTAKARVPQAAPIASESHSIRGASSRLEQSLPTLLLAGSLQPGYQGAFARAGPRLAASGHRRVWRASASGAMSAGAGREA